MNKVVIDLVIKLRKNSSHFAFIMKLLTVQHSFGDVINDVREGVVGEDKFWISFRSVGEEVQELYWVKVTKNGFVVESSHSDLDIQFVPKGNTYHVIKGKETYSVIAGHDFIKMSGVSCVNKLNHNVIMGMKLGDVNIHDLNTKDTITINECHYLDVLDIKVFPSNEVIMTVGHDHQIKLWSIKELQCIRTMVSDCSSNVELIEKGRNFLCGDKQGRVNLWECGSGGIIHEFEKVRNKKDRVSVIKLVDINTPDFDSGNHELGNHELEFGTKGKGVIAGYDSGDVVVFDIYNKTMKVIGNFSNTINSIDKVNDGFVFASGNETIIYKHNEIVWRQDWGTEIKLTKINHNQIIVYGTEVLIKLNLDDYTIKYLVGLPEYLKIETIQWTGKDIIVPSDDGIIFYK